MAADATHKAPVASAAASTSLTATFTEAATTFTDAYGLVAMVRRYQSGTTDVTPPTPSGWTLLTGGVNTNANPTARLFEGIYVRRGNGSVRSITITGASATTVINLVSMPNVKADTWWDTPYTAEGGPTATTIPIPALTATEDGSTVLVHVALGATFGTVGGPTWTGVTNRFGTSDTNTSSWASADVPAAVTDPAPGVAWTNQSLSRVSAVVFRTGTPVAQQTYPRAYVWQGGVKKAARIRGLWTGGAENVLNSWRINTQVAAAQRVPYLDPYDPIAWPNIPVGSGAVFEAVTAPMTAAWVNGTAPAVNKEAWSIAPFTSTTADPIVELREVTSSGTVTKTYTGVYAKATADATAGTDRHVLLVQPDGHTAYEVFKFQRPSAGVIAGTGVKKQTLRGKANETGTRAFGWASFIGLIRHHELAALDIPHVIAAAGPNSFLKSGPVWPAKWEDNDGPANYTGVVPMGTAYGIPPTVNVSNLGLSPEGVALAKAFQDYGMIITDRAGTGAIYMEPGGDAAAVARYNRMTTDYVNVIHDLLRRITNNNPGTMTTPYVPDSIAGVMGGGTRRRPFKAAFPPL